MKRTLPIVLILVAAVTASAQSVYTPDKGSPERKAILDALRIPVEHDLKQKVVFVADHFSVQGTWAFVSGTPQNSSGGDPDYSKTKYAAQVDAFDNNFFALLRKTGGKWKVTHYLIGCTDVCYLDWWSRYKAPKAIFPHTDISKDVFQKFPVSGASCAAIARIAVAAAKTTGITKKNVTTGPDHTKAKMLIKA